MKLISSMIKNNDCYKKNLSNTGIYKTFRNRGPIGIMIHSVGTPQPKASVFVKNYDQPKLSKAVHAFIEPDVVYQTMPWNYRGWHAGGSANDTHVGIEMTEPSTIRYTKGSQWVDTDPDATKRHVLGTYDTAVSMLADICKMYGLDPMKDGVIISHHEGFLRGLASNHGDVEHIWNHFGLTMKKFREDIKRAMGGSISTTPSGSYLVKVTAKALNFREGPSVDHKIVGQIAQGDVYTIVDESNGWGLLKSYSTRRNGWINLKYTSKL